MNSEASFDMESFERCLDVHGPELGLWPAAVREQGQRLLATSQAAQRAHESALLLARMLDEVAPIEPSTDLLRIVRELPARHPRPAKGSPQLAPAAPSAWWPFEGLFKPALAMVAAAALGILTGTLAADAGDGGDSGMTALLTSGEGTDELAFTDQEVEELSELAFALHLEESGWEDWP